jgi:hypothetical protein
MKVSIQRATLDDHGIGYGLLVKISVSRMSVGAMSPVSGFGADPDQG